MAEKFILDQSELRTRPSASGLQIGWLQKWLRYNNDPIDRQEMRFLQEYADLVSIVTTKMQTPLRRWTKSERFASTLPSLGRPFFVRISLATYMSSYRNANLAQRRKLRSSKPLIIDDPGFEEQLRVYRQHARLESFTIWATIVLGLAMLIGPLWILQHISASELGLKLRLVVITVFLILFTLLLSIIIVARPFEVLAATAAYGAVLMVFLQLGTNGGV